MCDWDPIGVMDNPDWPRDEYDCLIGPVLRMLEGSATADEIADYLCELKDHFGPSYNLSDTKEFAARLKQWLTQNWNESSV